MTTETTTDFDACTYYSCRDAERLTHETPGEALEDFLQNDAVTTCKHMAHDSNREIMGCLGGEVTVTGYVRDEVTDAWLAQLAERQAQSVAEEYLETYGDPDPSTPSTHLVSRLAVSILAAIAPVLKGETVWSCSEAATRTYTIDEVVALIGE